MEMIIKVKPGTVASMGQRQKNLHHQVGVHRPESQCERSGDLALKPSLS